MLFISFALIVQPLNILIMKIYNITHIYSSIIIKLELNINGK